MAKFTITLTQNADELTHIGFYEAQRLVYGQLRV